MQRLFAVVAVVIACSSAGSTASAADGPLTLLTAIGEWQYPGSTLGESQASDGETVDAKGDRTVPSVFFKTVMTTDASVEKVLEHYKARLAPGAKADGGKPGPPGAAGRSVFFSDDSKGRPFALHTVIVNAGDTSTTLVISRGKDEARTHIAWKQYRRLAR